mmetsp:Transcript_9280/g.15081  ORF Transcript_9280/g.15081 Transcript_9280/m.15081 type:complete len:415 (+) Transcript_9280:335-1579(+)|eukprot:CAMPEP_0203772978 /NCGR_PEP_ID=MMETSP0099_2-20121227/4372_1 /ASSEMBLY_ACC=CAM_ASM_000209 /TAXON_ID=96639 /ORGANISM=" , Strain NY0313808BC1" /LENGTH=414 /DNA_ID=CAMNT_0050670697 /DNA_START=253 /DNA_END=1497 /DNA_ORIENTATION=-
MLSWLGGEKGSGPIWDSVCRATDDMLLGPDWSANLAILDDANTSREAAFQVRDALMIRLKSNNPKICSLSLFLTESLVKNGSPHVLALLGGTDEFMGIIEGIGRKSSSATSLFPGSRSGEWITVEEKAMMLIQAFGQAFQDRRTEYPGFYDIYAKLTRQGVIFPVTTDQEDAPVITPPVSQVREAPRKEEASVGTLRDEDVEKLKDDISALGCKMDVADHLLASGAPLASDEVLDVLDFLMQCKSRIVELIEASAMGLLDDDFLSLCLSVNDRLCTVVDCLQGKNTPPIVKPKVVSAQFDAGADKTSATSPSKKKESRRKSFGANNVPKLRGPPTHTRTSSSGSGGSTTRSKPASSTESIDLFSGSGSSPFKPRELNQQEEGNPFDIFADDVDAPLVPQSQNKGEHETDTFFNN